MVVRLKAQAWNKSSNNATTNYYTNKYKKGLAPLYIAVKHGYAKAVKCSTKNRVGAKVQDKDTFFTSLRKVSAHNILVW
ncbi:hypothetical protein [Wolbachia endosymbiont of Ctenocephalides felis wCfeJ]|uniref:hypothetical protein n=1 Tax=Wolbachia endosymbiont of Ctenocephalides felis wCfeJ TaxID=2732594 RepID=UPI0014460F3C|nr:hypothetical protein [Wolbachia endosymbiont of Ctenocephalides felis wCfeJ]WCR58265.1 MAG: hypothetical protein PG980_000737 [Wolbachia endosymbiont of Ctenocephalides felis wCfeJ]